MSLIPARYNFKIYQNATFYKRVNLAIGGSIWDLTDYTSELIIKDEPNGKELMKLVDESGLTLGGTLGTIDIAIQKATTSILTWRSGVYELILTSPAARTDIFLRGGFNVVPF